MNEIAQHSQQPEGLPMSISSQGLTTNIYMGQHGTGCQSSCDMDHELKMTRDRLVIQNQLFTVQLPSAVHAEVFP